MPDIMIDIPLISQWEQKKGKDSYRGAGMMTTLKTPGKSTVHALSHVGVADSTHNVMACNVTKKGSNKDWLESRSSPAS